MQKGTSSKQQDIRTLGFLDRSRLELETATAYSWYLNQWC